jgi:hypothetical protein
MLILQLNCIHQHSPFRTFEMLRSTGIFNAVAPFASSARDFAQQLQLFAAHLLGSPLVGGCNYYAFRSIWSFREKGGEFQTP